MALPPAQLQANVATQNAVPHPKYSGGAIFNDKPSTKGNILLEQVSNYADSISRGGQSLGANLRGTDQGAPGTPGAPGNAVVQAQYLDRCEASRSLLLSAIDPESQLYRTCSDAVFARGDQIWTYLNGPQIVYIAPSRKEAQDHIHTVKTWTWESLPRSDFAHPRCSEMGIHLIRLVVTSGFVNSHLCSHRVWHRRGRIFGRVCFVRNFDFPCLESNFSTAMDRIPQDHASEATHLRVLCLFFVWLR